MKVILEQSKIRTADYNEPRHVSSLFMLYKTCPLLFWLIYINFVALILCLSLNIQISKIRTFLIESQPEECSKYDLKILVNLNLDVLIIIKKSGVLT